MTKPRFTNHQLYMLRNGIPIDALIEKALSIPYRLADGHFRFLCPSCKQFNTAVNPETNLARCFRCEKNFNTIDLVMMIRKLDFVESVRFLQNHHRGASGAPSDNYRVATTGSDTQNGPSIKCTAPSEPSDNRMVHIGHILDRMVPPERETISSRINRPAQQTMVNDRISRLEQKLDQLSDQVEDILAAIHTDNPSHQ